MKILVVFALLVLVSIISINNVFADHETSIKPTSPTGLIQTCGPNSPDCRNYPISKSESIVFEMHASGVYSPIGRFEISIDNQLSQFRNDGSCENGSCSSAITVTKIRENVHQIVINAQNLTDGDHTIKIDSINWIDGVVGGGKRTLAATYQFTIGNLNPSDGSFVLPCSMQEKGDGVSSSSCQGIYQNSIARAEVGINYHSGLFPITNYKAVGYFIDKNGNQGQNITVTLDKINPKESKTLVFTNTIPGFVSQFKMQMLGGTLVTSTDTDGDGISDSSDSCPTNPETVNGYQDTDGCPDVVPSTNTNEVKITPALGSGAPGCEETSQGCYLPKSVSVNVGGLVEFSNTDTAAHTFTAGTAAEGPSGAFDTGLLLAGSSYEWTPETVGEFPYHCMVHPWMEGTIFVKGTSIVKEKGFVVTASQGTEIPGFGKSINIKVVNAIQTVQIEIIAPNGEMIETLSFPASGNGEVKVPWFIPKNLAPGTYTVKVKDVQNIAKTTFEIEGAYIPPIDIDKSATGMLSDGTKVSITTSGEKMEISVEFVGSEHVNYDIIARQNGVILNDIDVHSHDGKEVHETAPLSSDPIEVTIIFQGYGIDDPKTGPIGEQIVLNIVPEFGSSDNENDISPTPDDLPYEIKITPTPGSSSPGCEETSQGCFIPRYASVATGGKVIFSNTDSAAHTFTAGTAADGPSGEFDTSLVIAGSSYEWTATKAGEIPYYCMVHPWREGILFVGKSPYPIPEPEPELISLNLVIEPKIYDIGNTVSLKMSLEGVSSPHDIGIDISDVTGKTIISRSVTTSSSGASGLDIKIAENFKAGTYRVVATTSVDGKTLKESTQFIVKSQYNQFKVTSVESTNQQGSPAPLKAGEIGFIKVTLESNKSITTLVTVNLFDSDLTSIGIGSVKTTLSSGNSEIILSFMIPKDAALGPADIYVNAFSDWPSNNGIPLTKEFAIQENIQ